MIAGPLDSESAAIVLGLSWAWFEERPLRGAKSVRKFGLWVTKGLRLMGYTPSADASPTSADLSRSRA